MASLTSALIDLRKFPRSEKSSPQSYASSLEEAQVLVRECAEPRPVGDSVKDAVRRASRRLDFTFNRTRDLWYGQARRVDADEMDQLRSIARHAGLYRSVAGVEELRETMLKSGSPAAHEVVSGLDAALRALGRLPR